MYSLSKINKKFVVVFLREILDFLFTFFPKYLTFRKKLLNGIEEFPAHVRSCFVLKILELKVSTSGDAFSKQWGALEEGFCINRRSCLEAKLLVIKCFSNPNNLSIIHLFIIPRHVAGVHPHSVYNSMGLKRQLDSFSSLLDCATMFGLNLSTTFRIKYMSSQVVWYRWVGIWLQDCLHLEASVACSSFLIFYLIYLNRWSEGQLLFHVLNQPQLLWFVGSSHVSLKNVAL